MPIDQRVLLGITLAGLGLAAGPAPANNVVVTNTLLTAPAAGKVAVQFDLAWENSWRDELPNYDACWVFVKYSIDAGATWSHATLAASGTNPTGFTNGTGTNLDIVVPTDKLGAFLQRSVAGAGTVSNTGVRLWWDFATNGISRSATARVKVFALEMVYVSTGQFYLGSTNGSGAGRFHDGTSSNMPFWVQTEGQISVSNLPGCLWGTSSAGSSTIGSAGVLPDVFPKGFAAFYLMKTEISQRLYCEFLNTLTKRQQDNRYEAGLHFNGARNYIKKTSASPAFFGCDANNNAGSATAATNVALLNETNDAEWVACNYLSWADQAAFADWSALRPMTELEFEKACRGPLAPVTDEYAWGSALLEPVTASLNNQSTAAEAPNQGNCNIWTCSPAGPYRVGSYANASSARTNSGASYYGALDLSGNIWERMVSAGHATGRAFTGQHGDGLLDIDGYADVSGWPGTSSDGVGQRGGVWDGTNALTRVSDRSYAVYTSATRANSHGCRVVRTAP